MQTILPKLPRTGERRLLKLIDFLEKLEPKQFKFNDVVSDYKKNGHVCGTVCCAVGWTPSVFPRLVEWILAPTMFDPADTVAAIRLRGRRKWSNFDTVANKLFGMKPRTAAHLFVPYGQYAVHPSLRNCGDEATPKQVTKMLRKYLKLTHTPRP